MTIVLFILLQPYPDPDTDPDTDPDPPNSVTLALVPCIVGSAVYCFFKSFYPNTVFIYNYVYFGFS